MNSLRLKAGIKVVELMPFLVLSFGVLATSLAYKNILFLHWIAFFIAMFSIFLFKRHKLNTDSKFLISALLLNVALTVLSSIINNSALEDIITVLFRYFVPVTFGILIISSRLKITDSYYNYWYLLLLLVTSIAYIQYFFSPTLWSFIPRKSSNLFDWSFNQPFKTYMLYFRATSILGSPQVWAAFSAISIITLLAFRNKKIGPLALVFLWCGSFLSGGKIAVLIFFMYALFLFKERLLKFIFLIAFILVVFFMYKYFFEFEMPRILEHVTGISRIIEEEQEGRLRIWLNIFTDMNIFFGGGPSYIEILDRENKIVAESYILQTWVELTIIFPLIFVYLILRQVIYYRHSPIHIVLYGAILASAISSHALSHPIFIVLWPLLIDHCKDNHSNKLKLIKNGNPV